MKLKSIFALMGALVVLACGGGGGGGIGPPGNATIVGKVVDVEGGGAPNPQASVQVGSASTLTQPADGSFSLGVPAGTTSLSIDPRNSYPVFTYSFPPASGTTGVGDLWIGPVAVTVKGRVLSSADGGPVQGVDIEFAGRTAVSGADGKFTLSKVAYPSGSLSTFWGIVGSATAPGFIPNQFTANPSVAAGGVVTLSDIVIVPEGDDNPPPGPANIWGRISPTDQAPGTVVSLKEGAVAVRSYTVGTDATYYFWVLPGTYTISFHNGSLSAPDETVTLNTSTEVVRRDVALK